MLGTFLSQPGDMRCQEGAAGAKPAQLLAAPGSPGCHRAAHPLSRCPPSHHPTLCPRHCHYTLSPKLGIPPQPCSPVPHGFGVPLPRPHPSTTSGCLSKGLFRSWLTWSPPASPCPARTMAPAGHAAVPAGSSRLLVPALPQLLAGLQAQAHTGPGHLVVGWGSAEVCVAPTYTPTESPPPGTPPAARGQIRALQEGT